MSDPCDLVDQWNDRSRDERFESVKEWMEAVLADWGVEGVGIEMGPTLPGNDAEYDGRTRTIRIRPDVFDLPGGQVMYLGGHEIGHALQHEILGDPFPPNDGFEEALLDSDADEFVEALGDLFEQECEETEEEVESSVPDEPSPAGDWNLSPEGLTYA
jgi:Putative neutral zinc metallopeptidase